MPGGFTLDLPLVPSLNGAYVAIPGKRVPSKEHVDWKRAAGWTIQTMKPRPEPVTGPYTLTLLVPQKMRGDVSNRPKLLEDLLVEMGLTPDDSRAEAVVCRRDRSISAGMCRVTVEAVGDESISRGRDEPR